MSPSREVAEAVGAEGESLDARRERLMEIVATPSERDLAARELMQVETEIAERDRAALQADVEARLLGIKKAFGSLAVELERDVERVGAAADAYAAAWAPMVARFMKLGKLRGEYDFLREGFQVAEAPLPPVAILATRKDLAAAQATTALVGVPDTNRIFKVEELIGTDGYALLQRAGKLPPADPPPSSRDDDAHIGS